MIEFPHYTENFCEENIWHLCQHPGLAGLAKKVLIVSNSNRNCPFGFQKSSKDRDPVWWDYHVILLASDQGKNWVYDFDSALQIPSLLEDYLGFTFQNSHNWPEGDLPFFKVIESSLYVNAFFSYRSHMIDPEGNWICTPPRWPLIRNNENLPLPDLLDFSETSKHLILSLNEIKDLIT